jgi:ADP-ribose pyrophosphatase YjhB (NUDIX family)
MDILVRPTGVLIEDNRILVVKQWVTPSRGWSLPGGRLEAGETIEECLVREMREETGLEIRAGELLYISDRFFGENIHIVHLSFRAARTGLKPGEYIWTHNDPRPTKSSPKMREIKMIPIDEMTGYGFSEKYCQLVKDNFPGKGSYQGDYYTFYGETPDGR